MQYLGGKSRIAKQISEIINNNLEKDSRFVSLFCGACSIESKVECGEKILNDSHEYLIEMFRAIQNGWEIPEVITEEDYHHVKNNKDENKALTAFVGFGCGFGGRFFRGYATNKSGTNYALQAKNSLLRKMKNLEKSIFVNKDYKDVEIKFNDVVYCDPPYENTEKYSNSKDFNHKEFWNYVREISSVAKIVLISETTAPNDFLCVWEKDIKRRIDRNKDNVFHSTEKLFMHESNLYKVKR